MVPAFVIVCVLGLGLPNPVLVGQDLKPGLAGTYFNGKEFTEPEKSIDFLTSVDQDWGKSRGNGWSARWAGFIEGPTTGEVTFTADVGDGLRLQISDNYHHSVGNIVVIDGLAETGTSRT
ncbi:MAG: PA14 domain-containing protein [Planctomycetota bacterium]|jgi:hypothetical protein